MVNSTSRYSHNSHSLLLKNGISLDKVIIDNNQGQNQEKEQQIINSNSQSEIKYNTSSLISNFNKAISNIVELFQNIQDTCILVLTSNSKYSINSLQECVNCSNDELLSVSSSISLINSSNSKATLLSKEEYKKTNPLLIDSTSEVTIHDGCSSCITDEAKFFSTISTNRELLLNNNNIDDASAIIGIATCFCKELFINNQDLTIFIAFVEREVDGWLDLVYQMPGSSNLPFKLRRYAVRGLSFFSQTSFHRVNCLNDVIEIGAKALQNRPEKKFRKETSHLVIHVTGIPSNNNILLWKEKSHILLRSTVFTHPNVCEALSQAWGICILSPLYDTSHHIILGSSAENSFCEYEKNIFKTVGGEMPDSIIIKKIHGISRAIKQTVDFQSILQIELGRGNFLHDNMNRFDKIINKEGIIIMNENNIEISEISQSRRSSASSSTTNLARKTLKQLQLQKNRSGNTSSAQTSQTFLDFKSKAFSFSNKEISSSLLNKITNENCSKSIVNLHNSSSFSHKSEFLPKLVHKSRKISTNSRPFAPSLSLPIFYTTKKKFWQREIVMANELSERNILELEEKQFRRIMEAMFGDIKRNPKLGYHPLGIVNLVKARRKSSSLNINSFLFA